jgi:hypothetical protein
MMSIVKVISMAMAKLLFVMLKVVGRHVEGGRAIWQDT